MAQNTTTTSTQFTLNMSDIVRGLAVAVLTPVASILLSSLNAGSLIFDWKQIATVALAAFVAYIMKNFLTPAQIVIKDPEAAKSVKEGESTVQVKAK